MTERFTASALTEMEKIAKAATQGEWAHNFSAGVGKRADTQEVQTKSGVSIVHWTGFDSVPQPKHKVKANATHIATFSPSTVLRLIEAVRAGERRAAEAHQAGRQAVRAELTHAVEKFSDDDSMGLGQLIDVIDPFLLDPCDDDCVDAAAEGRKCRHASSRLELAPPPVLEAWQTIETAPKDGTPVLIGWFKPDGQWTERRAWFDREFEVAGITDDGEGKTIWKQAWTDDAVASFGYEETHSYEPTLWQPLPSPTVREGSGE